MKVDVLKIDKNKKQNLKDVITDEVPLTIYLNDKELVTLSCSPDSLKELSIGFLFSAGLVKSIKDVKGVVIDKQNWASYVALKDKDISPELIFKRLYTSGCGRGILFYNAVDLMHKTQITSDVKISAKRVLELMNSFEKYSATFRKTGGVHSAALSDGRDILVFKEDIGRHNAIDKIIGEALIKNIDMPDSIVLTSGRVSSDVMFKVQKMKACILASRSAPTNQAVRLASKWNLTLVGFVRGRRMNVYTARRRINT